MVAFIAARPSRIFQHLWFLPPAQRENRRWNNYILFSHLSHLLIAENEFAFFPLIVWTHYFTHLSSNSGLVTQFSSTHFRLIFGHFRPQNRSQK